MKDFHERKKERTRRYYNKVHGYKLGLCSACNGSGKYDSFESPPCGVCNGTGKIRYPGEKVKGGDEN